MRAVLDANVLVSAAISPAGTPARLVERWLAGDYDLVVSAALLDELARALGYPKLGGRAAADDIDEYLDLLQSDGMLLDDPADTPHRSEDPGDDYLIALAASAGAVLVSGDRHLLALASRLPIMSPRVFLDAVDE